MSAMQSGSDDTPTESASSKLASTTGADENAKRM